MKTIKFKLIFTIFLVFASLFVAFPWKDLGYTIPFSGGEYKLGLDLSWGIVLDYKIDLEDVKKEDDYDQTKENNIIEGLKSIVDKRVSSLNINDSVITSASYGPERHIIVEIPLKSENSEQNNENIKKAKEAIWKVVKIDFKEANNSISDEDYALRNKIATEALEEAKNSEYDFKVTAKKYADSYEKVTYKTIKKEVNEFKNDFGITSEIDNSNLGLLQKTFKTDSKFSSLSVNEDWTVNAMSWAWNWIFNIKNVEEVNSEKIAEIEYLFIDAKPSDWKVAYDSKGRSLSDKYFKQASVTYNQAWKPQVQLTFNDEWAEIFGELSTRLIWNPIAIFVGWELVTAPTVNSSIMNGIAVISWNYTVKEATKISNDINTWVIPAPIYLTSENNIDSKLWANSLSKLIIAWGIWLLLIIGFLVYVYRIGWLIAWLSLVAYTWVVLSIVKLSESVLTLASIAGLVLSIWMAIDASVLIFERIKDNLRKDLPLAKATEDGFNSSWNAIWDTNVTGLIIAVILYIFWINIIKGFWLMLAIWTIVSLFTVMYISRVLIVSYSNTNPKNENLVWKIK